MFEKKIQLGEKLININIKNGSPLKKNGKYYFGKPIFDSKGELCIASKWLRFHQRSNKLVFENDLAGNYRLYFSQLRNEVHIFDDFIWGIKNVSNHKNLTNNEYEIEYLKNHGFTTGGSTIYNEIRKLPPSSTLIITDGEIKLENKFPDLQHTPDKELLVKKVDNYFVKIMKALKRDERKKVLLYSGGVDSYLLRKKLEEFEVEHVPVFLEKKPLDKFSKLDKNKIERLENDFDLDLSIIQVDINDERFKQDIIDRQIIDWHGSFLFYNGFHKVKEKFGENILLISGQSADNIFTFGPSENTLKSFLRRNIIFNKKSLLSKMAKLFYQLYSKNWNYSIPQDDEEELFSIIDVHNYTYLLNENVYNTNYGEYLKKIIQEYNPRYQNHYSCKIYFKVYTYLQGSDNQVVINAANTQNLDVYFPFCTLELVRDILRYNDLRVEINHPKHCIEKLAGKKITDSKFEKIKCKAITIKEDSQKLDFGKYLQRLIS